MLRAMLPMIFIVRLLLLLVWAVWQLLKRKNIWQKKKLSRILDD
jgi:regulatory protein YycI of two-component signal transduction system YycFG